MPLGVERAFGLRDQPLLDWRAQLWRYLTPSATDFAAFDRRLIHQGLYLEALEAQTIRVFVCVDTSGSIDEDAMAALMTETDAILRVYPSIECTLYYADADLYGPYEVKPGGPVPPAQGGGGTDFRPFFAAIEEQTTENGICVYLTDGFGDFPDTEPSLPVLWAVVPGGLDDEKFPFGDVVRIV